MGKKKTNKIYLSPKQTDFVKADSMYTLFCGGIGSGKTHSGAIWAMLMALTYPKTKGIITANSYSQLKKATLTKFFEILNENGVSYDYKQQDGVIHIGDATIYAMSAEKYDLARGVEVGWIWSDECAFYREEAFDVFLGRIRDKKGPGLWKGTTTPNGFNWLYDKFVQKPLKNSKLVTGSTKDNLANLSDNYFVTLSEQYDERLAQQELDGQFVNLNSGKVYYAFDRKKHTENCSDVNRRVFVGLDFNVHPLCGVFGYASGDKVYISGELYLENSNTFAAAKEILKRYPYQTLTVIADDSGEKRKTSSSSTDYEILKRANMDVKPFRNPRVKDRYNNINRLFDHGKLIIDPSCTYLIADLEKMIYDNKDPMLSHISDALGYLCWHLMPMKKPRRGAQITNR